MHANGETYGTEPEVVVKPARNGKAVQVLMGIAVVSVVAGTCMLLASSKGHFKSSATFEVRLGDSSNATGMDCTADVLKAIDSTYDLADDIDIAIKKCGSKAKLPGLPKFEPASSGGDDECVDHKDTCIQAGQTCGDPDWMKSGDWGCICPQDANIFKKKGAANCNAPSSGVNADTCAKKIGDAVNDAGKAGKRINDAIAPCGGPATNKCAEDILAAVSKMGKGANQLAKAVVACGATPNMKCIRDAADSAADLSQLIDELTKTPTSCGKNAAAAAGAKCSTFNVVDTAAMKLSCFTKVKLFDANANCAGATCSKQSDTATCCAGAWPKCSTTPVAQQTGLCAAGHTFAGAKICDSGQANIDATTQNCKPTPANKVKCCSS